MDKEHLEGNSPKLNFEEEKESHCGENIMNIDLPDILIKKLSVS